MTECCISFPGPVSKGTLSHIVIDYLKYILYFRGQFPLPLDQLKDLLIKSSEFSPISPAATSFKINGQQIYHDISDRKDSNVLFPKSNVTINRTKQNFMDSISKFDNFFNDLLIILKTQNVKEIVLNIGPNMMNPKELYRVTLPAPCSRPECNTDYASLQRCKLQFFREIMHSNLWVDLKTDSVLPVSILLLLDNGVALNECMEQKSFYTFPKFCKQRTVCFSGRCNHVDEAINGFFGNLSLSNSASSVQTRTNGLWVKLKPDLKGFKSYSESRSRSCSSFI